MSWVVTGVGLMVALVVLVLLVRSYRRVGPREALLILGVGGTRVVRARGAFVWPVVQQAWVLPLDPIAVEVWAPDRIAVPPPPPLPTAAGPGVRLEAVVQVRIEPDADILRGRGGGFVIAPVERQRAVLGEVIAEQLARVVAAATVAELATEPAVIEARLREGLTAELRRLGLAVEAVTLREVEFEGEARVISEGLRR